MVDIFLDMAADSPVPVLSGTHSSHEKCSVTWNFANLVSAVEVLTEAKYSYIQILFLFIDVWENHSCSKKKKKKKNLVSWKCWFSLKHEISNSWNWCFILWHILLVFEHVYIVLHRIHKKQTNKKPNKTLQWTVMIQVNSTACTHGMMKTERFHQGLLIVTLQWPWRSYVIIEYKNNRKVLYWWQAMTNCLVTKSKPTCLMAVAYTEHILYANYLMIIF